MGGKAASSEGRSAGARLHEVPGLEEVAAAADPVGTRRPRAGRHAPGAQGGNRDGTAAGVSGGPCPGPPPPPRPPDDTVTLCYN